MKNIALLILFIFGTGLLQAQTAEEIVAKHIQAIGGDNWKKIQSMVTNAKITSPAAAGMDIAMSMKVVRDEAVRMDVSVMGMTQTIVVKGETGWSNNPFMGQKDPEPMTADMVKEMKEMTDIDGILVGYKEKGHTIEYMGTEDVEGVEAHKIKVNMKTGQTAYSLIDPDNFLELKTVRVTTVDGKEVETATLQSNYKDVEGVKIPFSMQQLGGPMGASTINVTDISINSKIPDDQFVMPGK